MQSSAAEAATKLPSDEHLKEPETNAEAVESNETVELTSAEEGAMEATSAEALLSESSEEKESSEDSEDQKKQVRFADPLHIVINYMQYPERFITIKPVSFFLTRKQHRCVQRLAFQHPHLTAIAASYISLQALTNILNYLSTMESDTETESSRSSQQQQRRRRRNHHLRRTSLQDDDNQMSFVRPQYAPPPPLMAEMDEETRGDERPTARCVGWKNIILVPYFQQPFLDSDFVKR